ncbi:phosphoribosylglycinamide formyltransferase [Betaproteobacteria bacterium]|nr:phosphoribosylglycinamide formyltransferase [Betaproteobacteria bacterium]GHU41477.1 phosphoribosylglycinamide formyltransferase [Betaproteobacteria bacterium]
MKRIVILISGRGSNMENLMRAERQGELGDARIVAVLSNRPDAKGLRSAADAGIHTLAFDHKQYPDRTSFDAALMTAIDAHQPDLVVLAGFMRILSEGFVRHYEGRLLNIHPSLLPAFPGLHTHQRALAEGVRLHGCSVHFVTSTLDHGPIILQAAVPVLDGDDEARLAARVLVEEHTIYPRAVRWFVEGRLTIQGLCVRVRGEPRENALHAPDLLR